MNIKYDSSSYYPVIVKDTKRVAEGVEIMRQALEQDYQESLQRGNGLPKDWRNRVFRS